MRIPVFTITEAASPWQTGQSKAPYAVIRLEITCTKAVWVENAVETASTIPTEIFAYLKTGDGYVFNHVCSAVDLLEISDEEGGTWCRKNSVDILFPAVEVADEAREKIESDIRFLISEIKSYTTLVGTETKEIF